MSSPSPLRDCVVIMMEGRYGRDRQSDSSTLECGHVTGSMIEAKSCGCNERGGGFEHDGLAP
jgi:hypothetical protein